MVYVRPCPVDDVLAANQSLGPGTNMFVVGLKGLHSSTFQLNLSRF